MADLDDVRLLIADTDDDNQVFTDVQIAQFLALENDSVWNAAARALTVHAGHIAQVAGPLRGLLDIRVGGEQSAAVLLRVAESFRRGRGRMATIALSNFDATEVAF